MHKSIYTPIALGECGAFATKYYSELKKNKVETRVQAATVLIQLCQSIGVKATPTLEQCLSVALDIYFDELNTSK